ncbi:dynactin subunit 1-like isoform X2 [Lineus longissimus]|uniref:dynactin subunit 1-like isoform X2 n=1 Tax=Lineus longissimus TaxID=88925 RepID=UPI002B4E8FE6
MAEGKPVKVGARVQVTGKDVIGNVAYVGTTQFSSGKWIGVVLGDAKGKNNGTVQGKRYFTCEDNHGIFVRQSQLTILDEGPTTPNVPKSLPMRTPAAAATGEEKEKKKMNRMSAPSGLKAPSKSGLQRPTHSATASTENIAGLATPRSVGSKDVSPAVSESSLAGEKEDKVSEKDLPVVSKLPTPPAVTPKSEKPEKRISQHEIPKPEKRLSQTVAADITAMHSSMEDKLLTIQQQQEIDNLRSEIRDLEEKLETIKVKRQEDKVKLKEYEKSKIQLQQLQEFKSKMQETHGDLQRQMQTAKNENRENLEAFERYKDEMSDLAETVEIATLDKEMAEEKCESLQSELESLKERNEELVLDLEILRGEISESGTEGTAVNFTVKQLEQQNERLKEALVKLRDLSNQEKQETQQMKKQLEKQTVECGFLQKEKEKLQAELNDIQNQMMELKDQVDAALGAEEMVEQLTDKNLMLEERMQELDEEKSDLEALCDMNEELQESTRENELELREQIDLANGRVAEAQRHLEAAQEHIADYENTISKFRELVAKLQEDNRLLRTQTVTEGAPKLETPTVEMFDFKAKFAETKASAKAIDMELRKLDVQQANQHVKILSSFMPDSFMRRGGDCDAVMTLLLIPRLVCKAELLANQAREKFSVPETITPDDVLKSNKAEQFSFSNNLIHSLSIMQSTLHQYERALSSCTSEQFLKIGTLLPELAVHEKTLDMLIDLLRKDQLDENLNLDNLEKSIAYFKHLYSVHLSHEKVDCTSMMNDLVKTTSAACDAVHVDLMRMKILLSSGQETSDISILFRDLEKINSDIRLNARKVKRRIPSQKSGQTSPLSFGKEVQARIQDARKEINRVVKSLKGVGLLAMQKAVTLQVPQSKSEAEEGDNEGLSANVMEEACIQATSDVYERESKGPYKDLMNSFKMALDVMQDLANAMENGEYDFDGTREKKVVQPVVARAHLVKNEISEAENIKYKFEAKDEDLKELRKQLKMKQEEMSEQQLRLGLIEKKLENSTKDGDERVDKIQRRLDETIQQLKRKEKEFEETMDALQSDIDTLEHEKSDLKDRLKNLSKKNLLEGLQRQSGLTGISGAVTGQGSPSSPIPGSYPVAVRDSPMLLQQIESLMDALKCVKGENLRLQSEKMKGQLAQLSPLRIPKKPTGLASTTGLLPIGEGTTEGPMKEQLNKLSKNTANLLKELHQMSACPKVVDIRKRKAGEEPVTERSSPANQLLDNTAKLTRMQKTALDLQVDVTNLLAANRTGGRVKTDFSVFPTPTFAKMLHEKKADTRCIGRVKIPAETGQGDTIPLHLQPDTLKKLHVSFVR